MSPPFCCTLFYLNFAYEIESATAIELVAQERTTHEEFVTEGR